MAIWIKVSVKGGEEMLLNMDLAYRMQPLQEGGTRIHFSGGDAATVRQGLDELLSRTLQPLAR
jgi:hypothetical protein